MAADTGLLQGELNENPQGQELEVEKLLIGFLRALLDEQDPKIGAPLPEVAAK